MRLSFFVCFLLLSAHAFPKPCTCERISLELGLGQSEHIFEAQVISLGQTEIQLKILKKYKGKFFERVQLGQDECAPELRSGETYVFYLKNNILTSQCNEFFSTKNTIFYGNFLKILFPKK